MNEASALEFLRLILCLDTRDEIQRRVALDDLINAGEAAGEQAIPPLIESLRHRSQYVRAGAALALGKLSSLNDYAIPFLFQLLNDDVELVQQSATDVLVLFDDLVDRFVPEALSDTSNPTRLARIVMAVGRIGRASVETRRALGALLLHEDPFVRRQAAIAAGRVHEFPDALAEFLCKAIETRQEPLVVEMIVALREAGVLTDAIRNSLLRVVIRFSGQTRELALEALSQLDPDISVSRTKKHINLTFGSDYD